MLWAPNSYAPGEAIQACWPCPSPLCQWEVQRTGTKPSHSETASAFLFGLSLPLSRNLRPFLLPIQVPHPSISPTWHQRQIGYLEINSPGSKRAQAAVYRVLYTMNLFAFANSLKIVPPLIVSEGSGETGENKFWPRELPTPQIVRTEESISSSQPQSWDSGSGLKCLFNYVHQFRVWYFLFAVTDITIYMSYPVYNESFYKSLLIHVS